MHWNRLWAASALLLVIAGGCKQRYFVTEQDFQKVTTATYTALDSLNPGLSALPVTHPIPPPPTLENLDRGPGHCDIVVEVRPGEVHAIGGNVRDSVSRSVFPLDANGFLSPISARPYFTVIENTLP